MDESFIKGALLEQAVIIKGLNDQDKDILESLKMMKVMIEALNERVNNLSNLVLKTSKN